MSYTTIVLIKNSDTNHSVKDCEDPNPLIRALAVRTMGCIRVDKITEYLCEPLRKCLKDEDPYVRKTAAVCVAKLHDINAQLVEDQGFLDTLKDLISDSNPMVWELPALVCLLCVDSTPKFCLCPSQTSLVLPLNLIASILVFAISSMSCLVFSCLLSAPIFISRLWLMLWQLCRR